MQNLRHDAHMHTRVCYKPKIPPVNVLIAGGTANLSFLVSMNRDFNPPAPSSYPRWRANYFTIGRPVLS